MVAMKKLRSNLALRTRHSSTHSSSTWSAAPGEIESTEARELQRAVSSVIAEQVGVDEAAIDESWTLEDLGATSFDSIQLFMLLEERFGISFSREQVAELVALPVLRFHEVVGRAHAVE